MSRPQIVIEVHNGLIQEVFCSNHNARVIIVDWDTEGSQPADHGIVEVRHEMGSALVSVEEREPTPIGAMRNTSIEKALRKAHNHQHR